MTDRAETVGSADWEAWGLTIQPTFYANTPVEQPSPVKVSLGVSESDDEGDDLQDALALQSRYDSGIGDLPRYREYRTKRGL
jgi:hypothetical protein